MPDVARRAHGCWGRKLVAFWLAALLALAPFADRGFTYGPGDQLLIQSSNPQLDALAQSREPVAAPRLGHAAVLGVLSRLLTDEGKPGLAPAKATIPGTRANDVLLALETGTTSTGSPLLRQRGALDAAHPPTGPPA